MDRFKKIISIMMTMILTFVLLPALKVEASSVTVNGGCTTRATAYNWGTYYANNTILATLPESEDDFWVQFSLPRDKRIYIRCSYDDDYEGMGIELRNSNNALIDEKNSFFAGDVLGLDTLTPFMAVACDNLTSSTRTYYIHIYRGDYEGTMYFSLTARERIKTGRGVFNVPGTATNPGNASMNTAGVDSNVLSLNLTNDSSIPPEAIVRSVSTSGTQSPSQGNVHHMIRPASQTNNWYTSTYASSSSGSYNISVTDGFLVKQLWEFKYNALATAKSTMKNVKLTIEWEYDLQNTDYETY